MLNFCPKFSKDDWKKFIDKLTGLNAKNCNEYKDIRDSVATLLSSESTISQFIGLLRLLEKDYQDFVYNKLGTDTTQTLAKIIYDLMQIKRLNIWEDVRVKGQHYLKLEEDIFGIPGEIYLSVVNSDGNRSFHIGYISNGILALCPISHLELDDYGIKTEGQYIKVERDWE